MGLELITPFPLHTPILPIQFLILRPIFRFLNFRPESHKLKLRRLKVVVVYSS